MANRLFSAIALCALLAGVNNRPDSLDVYIKGRKRPAR